MNNILIGQSGGPTAAINSSLAGVFIGGKKINAKKIYGMVNGIEGLLSEKIIDLDKEFTNEMDIELLKRTPSSFLGSCRYKLKSYEKNEKDYLKIFEILDKYKIDMFFYIGGNDSMDTIKNLSAYAKKINSDIKFVGIPKTIDNDLVGTDHTPGFGSAAKYIATSTKELIRDALVYDMSAITIVEIMGRNAGWLTASAALAKDVDCEGPDLIYLPEKVFDVDDFVKKVKKLQKTKKSLLIAVSEGIKLADGKYVSESTTAKKDAFGHVALSGTASCLANILKDKLKCKTRAVELNTLQRCAAHYASATDIDEAFLAGEIAVTFANSGKTGIMVAFKRDNSSEYNCLYGFRDIDEVANKERKVPDEFITDDGVGITKKGIEYLRPLILGELEPIIYNGLPRHILRNSI